MKPRMSTIQTFNTARPIRPTLPSCGQVLKQIWYFMSGCWLLLFSFSLPQSAVEVSVANRNGALGEGKIRLIFRVRVMDCSRCSQPQRCVRPAVVI